MTPRAWQQRRHADILQKIETELAGATDGISKMTLYHRTKISRVTIDKYLQMLAKQGKVERSGRLFFSSRNREIQLERYRLIFEILQKQEELDRAFQARIRDAEMRLKGAQRIRALQKITEEEFRFRLKIIRDQRGRGVSGTEAQEADLRDGLKLLRKYMKGPSPQKP